MSVALYFLLQGAIAGDCIWPADQPRRVEASIGKVWVNDELHVVHDLPKDDFRRRLGECDYKRAMLHFNRWRESRMVFNYYLATSIFIIPLLALPPGVIIVNNRRRKFEAAHTKGE